MNPLDNLLHDGTAQTPSPTPTSSPPSLSLGFYSEWMRLMRLHLPLHLLLHCSPALCFTHTPPLGRFWHNADDIPMGLGKLPVRANGGPNQFKYTHTHTRVRTPDTLGGAVINLSTARRTRYTHSHTHTRFYEIFKFQIFIFVSAFALFFCVLNIHFVQNQQQQCE